MKTSLIARGEEKRELLVDSVRHFEQRERSLGPKMPKWESLGSVSGGSQRVVRRWSLTETRNLPTLRFIRKELVKYQLPQLNLTPYPLPSADNIDIDLDPIKDRIDGEILSF